MENSKFAPDEPIAAIATALVSSALGVVRCSGKESVNLVSKIFSRPNALLNAAPNSIVYGWIKNLHGKKIDEVLVSVFRAPKSFTGEEMVEISCHGGIATILEIFSLLLQSGFRRAERGEFTLRAFLNGKTDLTRAEAIREIVESKTERSSEKAAGRLNGTIFRAFEKIKNQILKIIAQIEVEIEYPEDENAFSDSFDDSSIKFCEQELFSLCKSWTAEKLFQDGAKIVLCGKTNAGKSSLFNLILKENRAIVSEIAGTTRDWLESSAGFFGIPIRLFDTAGIRETTDAIEAEGVQMTREVSSNADLIFYVVDFEKGFCDDDKIFLKEREKIPCILIFNKCDKNSFGIEGAKKNWDLKDVRKNLRNVKKTIFVSAKTGEGVSNLIEAAKNILLSDFDENADENSFCENVALGSERQKNCAQNALDCVRHAILAAKNFSLDAVVQDLEDALDFIGQATGEITTDDILSEIFSNFCVGK